MTRLVAWSPVLGFPPGPLPSGLPRSTSAVFSCAFIPSCPSCDHAWPSPPHWRAMQYPAVAMAAEPGWLRVRLRLLPTWCGCGCGATKVPRGTWGLAGRVFGEVEPLCFTWVPASACQGRRRGTLPAPGECCECCACLSHRDTSGTLGSSGARADASQLGPAATALTSAAETESAAVTGQACSCHSAKDGAHSPPHGLTRWWQQFRKLEVYFLEITLKTRLH